MHAVEDARSIFDAAVAAVQPVQLLPRYLSVGKDALHICHQTVPFHTFNNLYVIGAGKAAAAMAVATEAILGDLITAGLVVTKYGHALPCKKISIREGAHPVPDEHCVLAVKETLQLLQQATADDIIICLISGGASALWCDVPEGLNLHEVQQTFDKLVTCGAAIHEINTVRKHLSSIKGGQLIRHCRGASVFALLISDVPGDDVRVIASGPTVGDHTTFEDAFDVLARQGLFTQLSAGIQAYIHKGLTGGIKDTPKPGDALFARTCTALIGNNALAVQAAAQKATALGYTVVLNRQIVTGDAEKAARQLVLAARQYSGRKPACIVQGGEATVKVTGSGKGGRNQHFVLAALVEVSKLPAIGNILILSGGTDGTDGPTDAAGALADSETLQTALQRHLWPEAYLHNHDAYHFFQQTGGLLITGATQTNVMDVMLAIVY